METKKQESKNNNSSKKIKGISKDKIKKQGKNPETPKTKFNTSKQLQREILSSQEFNLQPKTVLSINILNKEYDYYDNALFSNKQFGYLKSFGYNTFQGLVKDYNEDKIIVISQIKKPASSKIKQWPKMSYFAIFDGHGGEGCSKFLADNFLKYLMENKNFPYDIKLSLTETFDKIEEEFFKQKCCDTLEQSDRSGSCAIISLILDNKIFIANLGDSRAIISQSGGTKIKQLTNDHKPNNLKEFERAIKNGSKVYFDDQERPKSDVSNLFFIKEKNDFDKIYKNRRNNKGEIIIFREHPSNLAVMRSIGDIKSKKKEFGGNPGSIINKPEIYVNDINTNNDFIVMGCDGIFDDLSNEEVVNAAWYIFKNESKNKNYDIHELTREACDMIMKCGLEKKTQDNLSCIVIGLEGLEKFLKNKSTQEKINLNINNFNRDLKKAQILK